MSLQGETIEDLVTSYNSKLSEILDKHASVKRHRLHPCHPQPWFTDRIKDEIRVRCMKECMWIQPKCFLSTEETCGQHH